MARNLPGLALAMGAGIGLAICGCAAPQGPSTSQSPAEKSFTINIDRSHNGAAVSTTDRGRQPGSMPRTLAFRVTGTAPAGEEASTEARAAAAQAAIVDALIKAVTEARSSRGQSTGDFTMKIGPRLTIVHEARDTGYEARIALNHRGIEKTFVVRDGALQHPPQDFELIQRLFEETNGEFSLWSVDDAAPNGLAMATVGCYLPAGFDPSIPDQIASDAPAESP